MNNIPVWIVKDVVPEDDFILKITFADGKIKRYDMKCIIAKGGIFKKIANPILFAQAYADGTTVSWADDIDISPEELYENGVLI